MKNEKLRQKVLIVDDKKENLTVLRQVLKDVDADIVEATSGNEALAATLHHRFAVAILDVMMPGMDGYELAEYLRGDHKTKVVPIVFVTASYADDLHMFRGYEAGGIDYIVKPFDPQVLLSKVKVFLELDRYREELRRHRDHLEDLVRERTRDLTHLNAVLHSIRDVNQLIVHEKRPDRLIQGACDKLVTSRGFQGAWIVLADGSSGGMESACAGLKNTALNILEDRFKQGRLPTCCDPGRTEGGVTVIGDPAMDCNDCPLAHAYPGNAAMTIGLRHNGRLYGWMGVLAPVEFAMDPEEASLLMETADDLGFALHGMASDAKRKKMEQTLHAIFESAVDGILLADAETGFFVEANNAMCRMLGYSREEITGLSVGDIHPAEEVAHVRLLFDRLSRGEITLVPDITIKRKDGPVFPADVSAAPLTLQGRNHLLGIFRDISARKQQERKRQELQEQLLQAQKMESVGRLAGGIAHDFNNLLTTIIGNADLVLMEAGRDDPCREMIEEIKKGGERAANLTRQLLAFSRKQILQPKVICLNDVVHNMEKLLGRIIGEDLELETVLVPNLAQVKADVGQIEQVILNLCVNARDAMPEGGKLTIETDNVELDESYAMTHMAVTPGSHVMLAVSDTGTGMPPELKSQIFEPFFTTKEKGKGTGLGLSTVYGIVKQSDGSIWVYSEPGKGTTFKIYFPVHKGASSALEQPVKKEAVPQGSETILLVEDDDMVRKTTLKALESYGYVVLYAPDGHAALRILRKHEGTVHLMLTDVVMPGMSGGELAAQARREHTDLKVLYMSGYTDNDIVHKGYLDKGVAFIQKPFTPGRLAMKVKEVLDGNISFYK